MQNHHGPSHRDDRGFTLVELLIVIVILGILATVTVFAVRGITDRGQENSENTDLDTLETAISAYWMEERTNPSEAELVSGGYLAEESSLHDIAVAPDGSYTITNVRLGTEVGSGSGGSNTPSTPSANYNGWLGTPSTVAGLQAVSYGDPAARTTVLFIGGPVTQAAWNAGVAADNGLTSPDLLFTVVDVDQLTDAATIDALRAAGLTYDGFEFMTDDNVFISLPGASNVQQYLNISSFAVPALASYFA